MRSWSLLDNSLVFSSPSEQREQPFSPPAGRFAAAVPAEERPPSPLNLGSRPPSLGPPWYCSFVHSRWSVSISLSARDSLLTTRCKTFPMRKGVPPAMLPNSRSTTEYLKRRSRPASYCFQAGVVGWGPGLHRVFCADPSTV